MILKYNELENGEVSILLKRNEILRAYKGVDGFYVVNFEECQGDWSAWILIEIGQLLHQLNRDWHNKIKRDQGA